MRLTVKNLSFKYPKQQDLFIKNFSIEVSSNSFVCLAGPNGSGKSTLLRLICGLDHTDFQGEILWEGKSIKQFSRILLSQNIAYVTGGFKTYFPITVKEFVLQARFAHSKSWLSFDKRDRLLALNALKRLEISSLENLLINEISSGQMQLVLLARAIAQHPKVYILDEVVSGLDLSYQERVFKLFNELHLEGASIFLVCHDLNLASEFCPNVIWIKDGSLHSYGKFEEKLTTSTIGELYGFDSGIVVDQSPISKKPKIFWSNKA